MGRRRRPFGNLSVIILKKKMGLRPILILQGFKPKFAKTYNWLLFIESMILQIIIMFLLGKIPMVSGITRKGVTETTKKLTKQSLKSRIASTLAVLHLRTLKTPIFQANIFVFA